MRRAALLLGLTLALAGCGGGFREGGGSSTGGGPAPINPMASLFGALPGRGGPTETTVTASNIRIGGPEGFCIDTQSGQDDGLSAFVMLTNCSVLAGRSNLTGEARAVLTASVRQNADGPIATRLGEVDQILRSEAGRATLSRSGDAATVTVLDSFAQDNTLYLRLRDTSTALQADTTDEHWRAIFDLDAALVTLAVQGVASDPLSPDTGLRLLQTYAARVKTLNGLAAPAPPPAPYQSAPVSEERDDGPRSPAVRAPIGFGTLGTVGLFRRLLG